MREALNYPIGSNVACVFVWSSMCPSPLQKPIVHSLQSADVFFIPIFGGIIIAYTRHMSDEKLMTAMNNYFLLSSVIRLCETQWPYSGVPTEQEMA